MTVSGQPASTSLTIPVLPGSVRRDRLGARAGRLTMKALRSAADGFLVVGGEYNHGLPPALKNLLDHFLDEYFFRPSGIVCYSAGAFGGVRARDPARMSLAEMGMSSVPSVLPIPRVGEALGEERRSRRHLERPLPQRISLVCIGAHGGEDNVCRVNPLLTPMKSTT